MAKKKSSSDVELGIKLDGKTEVQSGLEEISQSGQKSFKNLSDSAIEAADAAYAAWAAAWRGIAEIMALNERLLSQDSDKAARQATREDLERLIETRRQDIAAIKEGQRQKEEARRIAAAMAADEQRIADAVAAAKRKEAEDEIAAIDAVGKAREKAAQQARTLYAAMQKDNAANLRAIAEEKRKEDLDEAKRFANELKNEQLARRLQAEGNAAIAAERRKAQQQQDAEMKRVEKQKKDAVALSKKLAEDEQRNLDKILAEGLKLQKQREIADKAEEKRAEARLAREDREAQKLQVLIQKEEARARAALGKKNASVFEFFDKPENASLAPQGRSASVEELEMIKQRVEAQRELEKAEAAAEGSRARNFRRTQLDLRDLASGLNQVHQIGMSLFEPAIEQAKQLEAQLTLVRHVADGPSGQGIRDLEKQLVSLDPAFGKVGDNAKQLYDIIQSGVAPAEAVEFLSAAAKAARGNFEQTSAAVQAGIPIWANFRGQVKDAADLQNRLQKTVDRGRVTFDKLGSSLGPLSAIYQTANGDLNDMLAAYSSLTLSQGPEQAATSLTNAIKAIIDPTSEASKQAEALGISFSKSAFETKGFVGIMRELHDAGANGLEIIQKLFPEIRGSKAAARVAGEGFEYARSTLDYLNNGLDISSKKFEEWKKTAEGIAATSEGVASKAQARIGQSLLPIDNAIEQAKAGALGFFADMNEGLGGLPAKIGYVGASIAGAAGTVVSLGLGIRQTLPWLEKLGLTKVFSTAVGAGLTAGLVGVIALELSELAKDAVDAYGALEELGARQAKSKMNTLEWLKAIHDAQPEVDGVNYSVHRLSYTNDTMAEAQAKVNARLAQNKAALKEAADAAQVKLNVTEAIEKLDNQRIVTLKNITAAERGYAEAQLAEFEKTIAYVDFRKSLISSTQEYKNEIDKLKTALSSYANDSGKFNNIGEFLGIGEGRQFIPSQAFTDVEAQITLFAKTMHDKFNVSLEDAGKIAAQVFEGIRKDAEDKTKGIDNLFKELGKGNADVKRELSGIGTSIAKAFESGDSKAALAIVEGLVAKYRIEYPEALSTATDAVREHYREVNKREKEAEALLKKRREGWYQLTKTLKAGNEEAKQGSLELGQKLQEAFDTRNFAGIDRMLDEIKKSYRVDYTKAVDIARTSVRAFRAEEKRLAQEAEREQKKQIRGQKKAAEELDRTWEAFRINRLKDNGAFESSLRDLAKYIYSQQNTPGVFLNFETVIARDQAAIERFASRFDLTIPEAVELATDAVKNFEKESEDAAKKVDEEFAKMAKDLFNLDGDKEYKKSLDEVVQKVLKIRETAARHHGYTKQELAEQRAVVEDFANAWDIDASVAIDKVTEKTKDFGKKNKEATDAFKEKVKELNQSWAEFVKSGVQAGDDFKKAVSNLGEQVAGLKDKGDLTGQSQAVLAFARKWRIDYPEAIQIASQASIEFKENQKKIAEETKSAWDSFYANQRTGSSEYKQALADLGQELLRNQTSTSITDLTVQAFAKRMGFDMPQAIGLASQALSDAKQKVEEQKQAEEQYLQQISGLWAQYEQARVQSSDAFKQSLQQLGQELLNNGDSINRTKDDVQRFANKWGIDLPQAIQLAQQAYQQAQEQSKTTTDSMNQDVKGAIDIWQQYWDAVMKGSTDYQGSLKMLGEELARNTQNQQASQAAITEFAKKWKLEVPDAIQEAIGALNDARKASDETSGSVGEDADEISKAFDDLATHILRSSSGYEAAYKNIGQLVLDARGDIRSLQPEIQEFADAWGYTLPDAIREAASAYDDVRKASEDAAQQAQEDARKIEDAFKSYFDSFQSESKLYKDDLKVLGQELVSLGNSVSGQRAKIEEFARTWGIDLTDAIKEAENAVKDVLREQEEARNGWGKLSGYAAEASKATTGAMSETQAAFAATGTSAKNLGSIISQSISPSQAMNDFKASFETKVTDPIKTAGDKAKDLATWLANLPLQNVTSDFGINWDSFLKNQRSNSAPGYNYGGFAGGGSFVVPGKSGTDTARVSFRATPGERVSISNGAQDGSVVVMDFSGAQFYGMPKRDFADQLAVAIDEAAGRVRRRGKISIISKG